MKNAKHWLSLYQQREKRMAYHCFCWRKKGWQNDNFCYYILSENNKKSRINFIDFAHCTNDFMKKIVKNSIEMKWYCSDLWKKGIFVVLLWNINRGLIEIFWFFLKMKTKKGLFLKCYIKKEIKAAFIFCKLKKSKKKIVCFFKISLSFFGVLV